MSDNDHVRRLIHAWLDGELDASGAEELLAELRADRARLQEVEELEAIVDAASRLPRPPLPPDFAQRTLARIEGKQERPSRWSRFLSRPVRLRFIHVAFAAPAAVAVLIGTAFLSFEQGRQQAQIEIAAPADAELVRFTFGGEAGKVELAGDFNGWKPQRLERREDGTFEVVLPLVRGRYEYALRVDGRWQQDPSAVLFVDDGFGGRNSVLEL